MQPLSGVSYIKEYRFGLLRVRGTLDGGLSNFACLSLGALLCLAKLEKIPRLRFWVGVSLLALPIVFSGSRGTWIMAAMMLMTWFGFRFIQTPMRFVTCMVLGFIAAPSIQTYLLSTKDQFGTFSYRQRLLETFLPVVWENPLTGWGTLGRLFGTGRFNHMIQGQSIIDMVNTFLSEALLRGVPGFVFFSGIFVFGVIVPLRRLKQDSPAQAAFDYPIVKWVCCFMPGAAFLLLTTSLVGHTWIYISLAASVAAALANLEPGSVTTTSARQLSPGIGKPPLR